MAIKTAFVVDDSRVAQVILGRLLSAQGLDVTEIESGEKALLLLEQGERPDIIFMDMMMPGLSGIETTVKIKENTDTQHIPVVMCTGNDTALEKDDAMGSGVSYIVAKPPEGGELERVLGLCAAESNVVPITPEITVAEAPISIEPPTEKTAPPVFVEAPRAPISAAVDDAAAREMRETMRRDLDEQIAAASAAWMPEVLTKVKALMDQEKTVLDQKIEEKAATWMPTVLSNVKSLIAEEKRESGDNNAAERMQQLAKVAVEQAMKEIDVAAKVDALIEIQTAGWLSIQQTKLEQALLPIMQEKMAVEVSKQVKEGLTAEAMLEIKSNVQDDVYATIEYLNENVINPLKNKVRMLMIGLAVLAVVVVVF